MSKDKKTKVIISEEALNDGSKVQEVEVRETKDQEQKVQELNFQGLKNQESKHQEIKLQETKKPTNLRANPMPVDGFVLSIDGKLKKRYESSEDAMAAGTKLKKNFPALQVAVYDATGRNYTPVELHCGASVANGT
jgi:hypothetical protein